MSKLHALASAALLNRTKFASVASLAAMCISGAAQATVVDFEGLPTGAAANPLVLGVASFETPGGFNFVAPAFVSTELCPSTSAFNNANCSLNLIVTFSSAASNISFEFAGNNLTTIGADIGDVQVFAGATLLGTVDVIVLDGSTSTHDLVNLTAFSGVTKLLISSTDYGGVTYDNFSFNAGVVPEPGTFALLSLGLAGIGLSRRRTLS